MRICPTAGPVPTNLPDIPAAEPRPPERDAIQSFCLPSLPAMNGLHGCARIGLSVFQTTWN